MDRLLVNEDKEPVSVPYHIISFQLKRPCDNDINSLSLINGGFLLPQYIPYINITEKVNTSHTFVGENAKIHSTV